MIFFSEILFAEKLTATYSIKYKFIRLTITQVNIIKADLSTLRVLKSITRSVEVSSDDLRCIKHRLRVRSDEKDQMTLVVDC